MDIAYASKSHPKPAEVVAMAGAVVIIGAAMLAGAWPHMLAAAACFVCLAVGLVRFEWAILLIVVLLPISRFPGRTEYVEPIKFGIYSAVALLWFMKKVFAAGQNRWRCVRENPLNVCILLFTLLLAVTWYTSLDRRTSLMAAGTHLIGFAYLYIFVDVFRGRAVLRKAAGIFVLTAVFVSLVAILQYAVVQYNIFNELGRFVLPVVHRQFLFFGKAELLRQGGYRSMGTLEHPNFLGIYTAMAVPLSIGLRCYATARRTRGMLTGAMLILLAGLFCAGSRGAFLNLLCSSIFIGFFYRQRIPPRLVAAAVMLSVVSCVVFASPMNAYFRLTSGLSNRNIIWRNSLAIAKERLLLGWGAGTFPQLYLARFGMPSVDDWENALEEITLTGDTRILLGSTAHNQFLNYTAELGLFAVFLLLLFYKIYLAEFIAYFKTEKSRAAVLSPFAIACAAIILGNFVQGFFEAIIGFSNLTVSLPFVMVTAMGLAAMHVHPEKAQGRP